VVYTEFGTVEKPIIDWLQELSWEYVSGDDLKRDVEEPFCLPTLRQAIKTLNPHVIQSDEDVEKVVNQLRRCSNDIAGNRDFFEWLKGEKSIVFKQGEKAQTIRLIDYDRPENNSFVVTNQFKFAGYENVRFDIALMVNGIPLVVIEAKTSTQEQIDYTEAINQLLRYHRDAPQILRYLAFVCATDGFTFKYDWTDPKRYFNWRNKEADPLEASVKGLFQRAQFLDFIQNFIVFEKTHEKITKKIAMQQQFNAVNRIVRRVLHEDVDRGLIWHTQGSGKTLTMLFAAWKLKKIPQLNNPTIIVIVDRLELQKNILDTFGNVNFSYTTKAENTRSLLSKLKQDSREVIITTIQKFEPIRDILSQRKNIIVLIDEAHRTQYGKLASYMRNAFPHAKIFGFTGTPIDKGPMGRSTFRTFCSPKERYLDKYSIRQSIEDGSTVRIIYEPRLPEVHVPKETLDQEFLKITTDLSEEDQDRVMQKSAKLRTILKARSRIEKVAEDIANHYRTHVEPNGFKAQLAAVDREACALYKEELDKHLPPEYSTVIYTPAPNDDERLRKYHMPKEEQLNIARNTFQRPEELPKIIIVTDMLLTGFDAPIELVMYLDKPLRDHKLLQAIARTNRPYPNKEAGIIIDYVGIFDNLKAALNFEEEEIEGVADLIDTLKKEFTKQISDLRAMFKGVERADSRESLFKVTQILEDPDRLKEFKQKLLTAKKLFETIAPDPELVKYLDDYSWFIQIDESYNKLYNRRRGVDLTSYQEKTKQLIRDKLLVDRIDKALPTLEIGPDYLKKLEEAGYTGDQKIVELRQALAVYIRINLGSNPIYETLGQRLERIIKSRDKPKMLQEMEEILKEINELDWQLAQKGITKEEQALLATTQKYLPKAEEKELIDFVRKLLSTIQNNLFLGWQRKRTTINEVEKGVFDTCFKNLKLEPKSTVQLSQELMGFIQKYRP